MSLSSLVPASLRISSVSRALSMKSSRRVSIAVAAMLALGACALRAHAATFPVISNPTPVSFGSQAVGSAQAQTTVTFNVTGPGTLSTTPLVLTTGQANLDYTLGTGSTCTGTVSVGTCTVKVIFTPRAPGQRLGAIVLQAGGSTVATALLYGTGTGPAVVFPGNTAINTLGPSGSFNQPYDVAVDGAGNVYVADYYHNAVKEILAVGGSIPASNPTINTLGASATFSYPEGVAVDGAGNVYVADTGHSAVKEIIAVGGSIPASNPTINTLGPSGTFSYPQDVAVDGSGNVYVADTSHNAVKEIVAVGGSIPASSPTIRTLGPSGTFSQPYGVAVDGAGNVYVADSFNNAVKEIVAVGGSIPASNPTINTLGPSGTFSNPEGVAVDGAGNVYVADAGHNAVKEIVAVGGSIPASNPTINTLGLSTSFSDPAGMAVDGAGNVYVADTGNSAVKEIPLATPPSLSFASTAVGATSSDSPQTVTLQNIGNSLLTFANPTSGGNPSISAGFGIGNTSTCPQLTSTSSAGTLASGASCTDVVSFKPVAGGTISGSLVTTDNTLNAAGSTQSVSLGGMATTTPPVLTLPANQVVEATGPAGAVVTYTATATDAQDGTDPVSCSPASGSTFALGTTQVNCSATDSSSNRTSSSFTVTVQDTTPPAITVPANKTVQATSAAGAVVTYTATATDAVDGTDSVTCAPTSGSTFAMGTTQVTCSSTDAHGNKATKSFSVTVQGPMVTSISPTSGPVAGGTPVTISGAGFTGETGVRFGGVAATNVVFNSDSSVTATSPALAGSNTVADVTVTTGVGTTPTSSADQFTYVYPSSYTAPTTAVGVTSATQTAYVTFTTAGTPGTISVLTQGATGLDFAFVTGGTCSTSTAYAVAQSCTVQYTFTPSATGPRYGAVVLSSGATVLGTSYLGGVGTGPVVGFTQSSFSGAADGVGGNVQYPALVLGGTSPNPTGNGNVLYIPNNSNVLYQDTIGTGTAAFYAGAGSARYRGAAVDGAGNVYVSDVTSNNVFKLSSSGTLLATWPVSGVSLSSPWGMVFGTDGTLYVANPGANDIVAITPAGVATVVPVSGYSFTAYSLGIDGSNNLYIPDNANSRILKVPGNSGAGGAAALVPVTGTAISGPGGVAVDSAGELYITEGNSTVLRISAAGVSAAVPEAGLSSPAGVVADNRGHVYVTDAAVASLFTLTLASPPALSFGSVAVGSSSGAQNVTLENSGNASLSFGLIQASNASFGFAGGVASGSTPGCGGPMAAGALCNVQATFTPQSQGALTANGVVTDNSLNVSNATQTVVLNGTGTGPFTVTGVSPSYGPAAGGTTVTITGTDLNNVTQVTFGGVAATSFTLGSATQMTAVAPAGTGTVDIIVGSATDVSVATTADRFSYVGTYTVTVNTDTTNGVAANCVPGGNSCSLRDAIAATNAAGFTGSTGAQPTINFALGQGAHTITLNSPALNPTANVNIAGPGAALLTIAPTTSYTYSAFTSTTNSLAFTLSGVTVTGFGFPSSGASPALLFSPNSQSLASGDLITLNNDTFSNNGGTPGGTTASNSGGALNVTYSTLAVAGSIFTGNSANSGGAIFAGYANVAITGSTFGTQTTPNRALTGVGGGALCLISSLANSATIGTSTFAYNTSKASGASVYAAASLTLNTDVFLNNAASNGGAVYATGALTVAGSTFNNNTAASNGGAIYVTGLLTVSGSSFTANQAGTTSVTSGGAIYSSSTGANSISNTNFLANRAVTTNISASGGALYAAVANLTNVLFSGNYISSTNNSFGGAAYYTLTANSQLTGVTFTGNSTQTGSTGATNQEGGALYLAGSYVMRLYNSTINGNSAKLGGGVYNSGDGVTNFYNSVTSGNSGSNGYPDFDNAKGGGYHTDGNDYVDVAATCSTFCTPLLSALGNYGGGTVGAPGYTTPVQVMLPLPGSPLLAAGSLSNVGAPGTLSGGATTDARGTGYPRTLTEAGSSHVDIGAAEANYSLSFMQQPTDTPVGVAVSPAPTVQLLESGVVGGDGVGNDQGSYAGGTLAITATPDAASNARVATTASGLESLSESFTPPATGETLTVAALSGAATPVTVASATSSTFNVGGVSVTAVAPTTAVGTTSATQTAYVTFTTAGTLGQINVLTQGAPNLDYQFVAGGTCATGTAYTAGQICTVLYSFTPTAPGLRSGAVVLMDASRNILATNYLQGTGTGPLLTIVPGIISTIAGNGSAGYSPSQDGGQATSASLNSPYGAVVDGAGNVYIADTYNARIRKVTPGGTITTLVGNNNELGQPSGVAVDGAGNIYIADSGNNVVLKYSIAGVLTAVAGTRGSNGYTGDGGAATSAKLFNPTGVAVDVAGNVYIADQYNSVIRYVSGGIITTVAGGGTNPNGCSGSTDSQGDGCVATSAKLFHAAAVGLDGAGNLYIADSGNQLVRKVTTATGVITTVAGNGGGAYNGDGIPATSAQLSFPQGVAVDAAGDIYIADNNNQRVRKVTAATGTIATIAGTGGQGFGGDGGAATSASFTYPPGVTLDAFGNLYVVDNNDERVRKITATPSTLSFGSVNDGSAAQLNLTVGNAGNASLVATATSAGPTSSYITQVPGSGTPPDCTSTLAAGSTCDVSVQFAPIAPASGVITGTYSVTNNNLNVNTMTTVSLTGMAVPVAPTVTAISPTSGSAGGGTVVTITGTGFTGATGVSFGTTAATGVVVNSATSITATSPAGTGTVDVTVTTPNGTSATSAADQFSYLYPPSYMAPTTAVGVTSATQTAYVVFTTSGTLGQINVLTQGAANLDYKFVSGGTCATMTAYMAGQVCTVLYSFTPSRPGQRLGAISLTTGPSSSATVLVTVLLNGTGVGPLATFPGSTTLSSPGSTNGGFVNPVSVAVDGRGDIFVTDVSTNTVKEIVAVNGVVRPSSPVNTVGSGFSAPFGVAVDGSGDIFVADTNNQAVKEIVAVNGVVSSSSTVKVVGSGFTLPVGVTVDGNGDIFISDIGSSSVKEIVAVFGAVSSSSTVNTVGSGFSSPYGVVVDGSGDVFVADAGNNAVKEIVAVNGVVSSSSTVNTVGSGFSNPFGVAVDGSGDVFVADYGNSALKEIVAVNGLVSSSSTVNTVGSGFSSPRALVVDGSGHVFVADTGNQAVKEIDLMTAPAQSFASTTVGATSSDSPRSVAVQNAGNAVLMFTSLMTGTTSFPVSGTGTCSTSSSLAASGVCTVAASFTPKSPSALTDTLTLTDNSLNVAGAMQMVALSGTGSGSATVPVVTAISPTSGPTPGGTTVTITGTNFAFATAVSFGGTAATSYTVNSATSITVTSPAGTGTVDVTVTTSNGTSATSAADRFTYVSTQTLAKLTVTGYPAFAPTGVAQNVTVTAYDANNNVIPGFTGTVTITSSDPAAALPAPYAYTLADAGTHVFSVTLNTAGTQSITATSGSISGSETGILSSGYIVAISNSTLSKFTENGTPFNSSGYTGGGGAQFGAAVDAAGDVFSVSNNNSVLVEFNNAGTALSGTGYAGGGINTPQTLAVDGAGQVWVVNGNSSLSVFTNSGVPVTPNTGYASGGYSSPLGIAIDVSGNVWVTNSGSGNVIEVLGAAAPTAPASTALTNGTTGARP